MHLLITFVAAVVLIGGIFINQRIENTKQITKHSVLSEKSAITPTLVFISGDGGEDASGSVADKEDEEDNSELAGPQGDLGIAIDTYIYPDSIVNLRSATKLELASTSVANIVTDWYKQKLISSGMGVKSFVRTNANGEILNKLSATDGKTKVDIEISQKPNEKSVKIIINLNESN